MPFLPNLIISKRGTSEVNPAGTTSSAASHAYEKNNTNLAQKRVMDEYNRVFLQTTDREKQLTLQYFMELTTIENEINVYPYARHNIHPILPF